MAVYQGPGSCYARREGRYVKWVEWSGLGALRAAAAIARLILRDYRRGYTYEQGTCRRIRMDHDLFEKRLRFLVFLARVHGAPPKVVDAVERLVRYVLRHKKLPKTIKVGDERLQVKSLVRGMYARIKASKKTRQRAKAKRR